MLKRNHVTENINKRFILEINAALAMENAGIERLESNL